MPLPVAHFIDDEPYQAPISKVVCVGRNYAEHAAELNNPVPTEPLLFIKPPSAVVALAPSFALPTEAEPVHYETEIALLVGKPLRSASEAEAMDAVVGIGLALDLTLRERQSRLKEQGHPWETAKAFDGACPLSRFVPAGHFKHPEHLRFSLSINGETRQLGDTGDMIKPIPALLSYMSKHFTLEPGDVVLTGTPAGVGVLERGQSLLLTLEDQMRLETRIA